MEDSSDAATARTLVTSFPRISSSPSSSSSANSSPSTVVFSPCAACRALRRRCTDACVLAPYFPPADSHKFSIAHRVFGASNIVKFLQEIPQSRRPDAVESMVYEANARLRDPVYGCAGLIFRLQKEVSELQAKVARSQANCAILRAQQANLFALGFIDDLKQQQPPPLRAGTRQRPDPPPVDYSSSITLSHSTYFTGDCGGGRA